MALDTLANVKLRLGITSSSDDSLLALLQDSAEQMIEHVCQRDFAGGTFTEYLSGGTDYLLLRNYPILSVTSLKVDPAREFGTETILPTSAYIVHTDRGVIQSTGGPFLTSLRRGLVNQDLQVGTLAPRSVQVIYTTQTAAVPNDVKHAYARLIGEWYRRAKTEGAANFLNVQQQKIGEMFTIYGPGHPDDLPADVKWMLLAHRTPQI